SRRNRLIGQIRSMSASMTFRHYAKIQLGRNHMLRDLFRYYVVERDLAQRGAHQHKRGSNMNRIIYIVGLVVVVLAIISFLGLG
ncbi:hypothetical protein, partial [uncultured Roseobacter sp.]|uniref:hypothetical protein n=1 Tax=uncultured Roseobacter sp. TaxID=114847 RepID=UPI002617B80E